MTFGDMMVQILDDQEKAVPKWAGILGEIMEDLTRLECGLVDMKLEALRLESAGMWPAVPTESWEGRNGRGPLYLRLLFPAGTNGKRRCRVYIGSKPEAIADARRKTANRIWWEKLDGEIGKLERHLSVAWSTLGRVAEQVGRYRLPDLGTAAAPPGERAVPKAEGKR